MLLIFIQIHPADRLRRCAKCLVIMVLLGMGIFSCKEEAPLPIEENKLVKILCDVHVAESALQVLNGTQKDSTATKLYGQICSIHQIERADLDTCLAMLKRNPKTAAKLYEKVVVEMEGLKKRVGG